LTDLSLASNRLGISSAEGGDASGVGAILALGITRNATLTLLDLDNNSFSRAEVRLAHTIVVYWYNFITD
jgi:hypothetical protein